MNWISVVGIDVLAVIGLLVIWSIARVFVGALREKCPQCGCFSMVDSGPHEMTCNRCGLVLTDER
jgi:hypothetical protein